MVDQNSPISFISGHIKLEPKVGFHKFLTQDPCSDKNKSEKGRKDVFLNLLFRNYSL